MDDKIQMITSESSQYLMSEMKRQLPRIAEMLGTTSDKLSVMDYNWFPHEYMNSAFRDVVVETAGVLDGMPMIQKRRQQTAGQVGLGIFIYRNYLNPDMKYAIYIVRGPMWEENYLICKKGDLYQLKRNALKLNKLSSEIKQAPILAEGLLEEIVQNTIGFLLQAREIEKYGVKIKRGVILDGPPGNGKTMACRYIQKLCAQHGIRWGVITSADIDEAYQEKSLSDLFQMYTVSFFDDIDISYMDRAKGNGKMACSLLTAMDGMYDGGHLVRIFTTNEQVEGLDKAFTRPGRIDKCITIELPDAELRERLVKSWPQEICDNIDIEELIQRSDGFSFAELEAIRTFLVTNKILGDGGWDLTKAFDEYNERRAENRKGRKGLGFLGDKKKLTPKPKKGV
jgi:AAA+ superfamily predicted ATPase